MTLAATFLGARSRAALPAILLLTCLASAVAIAVARSSGAENFATDPLGVVALGGAALSVAILASRTWNSSRAVAVGLATLAVSIALYLVLAAWATSAEQSAWETADLAARLWTQAWIAPLSLVQIVSLRAVDRSRIATTVAAATGALAGLAAILGAVLGTPSAPFAGVATISPVPIRTLGDAIQSSALDVWLLSLLAAPVLLAVRTLRARPGSRAAPATAASAAALPVLAVIVCLALAVVRDPGAVDPSIGSLAFLVTHSAACAAGALTAVAAHSLALGGSSTPHLLVRTAVATVLGGYAAAAVIVGGILAAHALRDAGIAVTVLVVGGASVAAVFAVRALSDRLLAFLLPPPPEPPSARVLVESLSPRETEVLEALASGASNAGIASRLVVSERTVDAHLRSIFAKLALENGAGDNRRVLAARLWFDAAADANATDLRDRPIRRS